jgi:hypothetical protein
VRIDWTTALDRHARTPRSGREHGVGEQDNGGSSAEGDGSCASVAKE